MQCGRCLVAITLARSQKLGPLISGPARAQIAGAHSAHQWRTRRKLVTVARLFRRIGLAASPPVSSLTSSSALELTCSQGRLNRRTERERAPRLARHTTLAESVISHWFQLAAFVRRPRWQCAQVAAWPRLLGRHFFSSFLSVVKELAKRKERESAALPDAGGQLARASPLRHLRNIKRARPAARVSARLESLR